jgi:3-oxoacyl-[acyl-carrier protein] reductase
VAFDLTGRVAVVTGAGSGIGAATAAAVAAAGATVIGADLPPAAGETDGWRVCDVTDESAVAALGAAAVADHGRLDVWVNVAGVIDSVPVAELTRERFDRVFAVNFFGALYGCQTAVRAMTAGGAIVNVVSAAIDEPAPGLAAYAVSKAALTQLTRTLALEVGRQGIRVNAVAPGFIETPMTARHFTRADGSIDPALREKATAPMRRRSPLGMVGEPADVAAGIVYLVSDEARFVTGEVLRVNGGTVMR